MTTKEREQLERLIAQLEDPAEVRKAYVIPNGCSREFTRGYVDGAKMQAGAIAMALRGLVVAPPELRPSDVGYAESVLGDQTKGINLCDPVASLSIAEPTDKVDVSRIKRRGLR